MDPHSHARPEEAVITHLSLDLNVDMEARRLKGTAAYAINRGKGDTIRFDTDGLTIHSVKLADGTDAPYTLGDTSFLGRELAVKLPAGADSLIIAYETGPGARALQWLSPGQTADKTKP
ncbi:MAG TPA: aminopeptidase, partial [Flavobacteriales bacterium]|nr:aminopeptidase [Flavobacteriales bacterium]